MKFDTLVLPIDKYHMLRKGDLAWEYSVQENEHYRKVYYFYPNEVDNKTYNFEGFITVNNGLIGGIVVNINSDDDRVCDSFNMKNVHIRHDELSMLQMYENLSRCTSDRVIAKLKEKKHTAKPLNKMQSVELPLDKNHRIEQTVAGLWRYISDMSKRIYVFYLSEISFENDNIMVTLYDRSIRIYDDKKPMMSSAKDVVIYLISREKESYFEDSVTVSLALPMIVHRRGWGNYIHYLDTDMNVHAFKLGDRDEVPSSIPHILDIKSVDGTCGIVKLYEDSYEDILCVDGKYIPQNIFYSPKRIANPQYTSKFYDQKNLLKRYLKGQVRYVRPVV